MTAFREKHYCITDESFLTERNNRLIYFHVTYKLAERVLLLWRGAATKKAGRLPVRAYIGPAKNLFLNDRETPSKTRRHNTSLLMYFISGTKGIREELGWFIYAFAEITDTKNKNRNSGVSGFLPHF